MTDPRPKWIVRTCERCGYVGGFASFTRLKVDKAIRDGWTVLNDRPKDAMIVGICEDCRRWTCVNCFSLEHYDYLPNGMRRPAACKGEGLIA